MGSTGLDQLANHPNLKQHQLSKDDLKLIVHETPLRRHGDKAAHDFSLKEMKKAIASCKSLGKAERKLLKKWLKMMSKEGFLT